MVKLADARAPEGLRLYAIGDVHGCSDLLGEIHARIARDLERRPVDDWRVIHIGDNVDRGPDSAGALAMLMTYRDGIHTEFLLGNHDQFLRDFLKAPNLDEFELWMFNGGAETLDSFGLDGADLTMWSREVDLEEVRDKVLADAAEGLLDFLSGLSLYTQHGDYAFAHAGIMPGWPLDEQSDHDLTWIRAPFLESDLDHGAVIVHGHTPTETVELHPNRIAIDTGAVFSGVLSCLVLEGAERSLLGPEGPDSMPFIDRSD